MDTTNSAVKYKTFEDNIFKNIGENVIPQETLAGVTSNENNLPASDEMKISKNIALNLQEDLRNFIAKNNPKVYLLSPCFNGTCYVNYVTCLINTIEIFRNYKIPLHIEFCKCDSLVPRARNNLIARAMSDPQMTHMIFIDNDISWNPVDIIKLLIADKPIVGAIYPLKHYNWERLLTDPYNPYNSNVVQSWVQRKNKSQVGDRVNDVDAVKFNMVSYNVNYLDNKLNIQNNLAKVKHAPTGFMMLKRSTIEAMFKSFPSTKYVDDVNFLQPHENEFAYALFDCGVEEGHYFSEDWLFCHRWMKMGGEIFIDVSINLIHTGIEDYYGSYILSIL